MSYVLSLYSASDQLITTEQIKSQIESLGWSVTFVSGFHLSEQTVLESQGPLKDDVIIYGWTRRKGWETQEKDAILFSRLMAEGKFKELWDLPNAFMVIANCTVSYSMAYDISQDWDEDEIAELEEFDAEYVGFLRRAKSEYAMQAGRSNGSVGFAQDIGRAIGNVVGGLWDEPSEGIIEYIKAQ